MLSTRPLSGITVPGTRLQPSAVKGLFGALHELETLPSAYALSMRVPPDDPLKSVSRNGSVPGRTDTFDRIDQ